MPEYRMNHSIFRMNKTLRTNFILGTIIVLFCGQSAFLIVSNSAISDEVAHIVSGYDYVKNGIFDMNLEHPLLVKQWAALPLTVMKLKFPPNPERNEARDPWTIGRSFLFELGNNADSMIITARAALLPLGIVLIVVLFLWSDRLFGPGPALLTALLASLIPDLVVHSTFVTTDVPLAVFFFFTFYFLWRYDKFRAKSSLYAAGIVAGLALSSKFSAILIFPMFYGYAALVSRDPAENHVSFIKRDWILPLLIFPMAVTHRLSALIFLPPFLASLFSPYLPVISQAQKVRIALAARILLTLISLIFLVAAVVYFNPHYWSEKFRPYKLLFRGWAIFRGHSTAAEHVGFLFGEYSGKGWWYYYVIAMLVKIPVPALIAMGTGVLGVSLSKSILVREKYFIFIPPLFFFLIASFANTVNIGVRHILPVYPFLLLASGWFFRQILSARPLLLKLGSLLFLFGWLSYGAYSRFPHYVSSFNELAGICGGGDQILSDSNISWGQDLKRLRNHLEAHPVGTVRTLLQFNTDSEMDYYGLPHMQGYDDLKQRVSGWYAMDVFTHQGLIREPEFQWLREIKPAHKIGGSIYLFNIEAS